MMNTVFEPNTPFMGNIRKVILLCTAIIIGAIVGEFFLIESLLSKREKDAFIINTAGRQRTLVQKITKNMYLYHHDSGLGNELKEDAKVWRATHRILQENDDGMVRKDITQSKADSLFSIIDSYQKGLYEMAMDLDGLSHLDLEQRFLIRKWENGFSKGMDDMVNLYQKQSEKGIFTLELTFSLFSIFFVSLILIMYFFLINPVILSMRKIATKQKRQNDNMISVLENTEDLIWSVDKDYRLLTFNSRFKVCMEKEHGKTPCLRSDIFSFFLESREKDKKLYDRALAGESFRMDWELDLDGTITYHELSFHPIKDGQGKITGCNVSRRDETQRIQTLNEVKRSRKRLKEAQRIAKLGHWTWEIATDRSEWSENMFQILGLEPESFEVSVANFIKFIHPDDKQGFVEYLNDSLSHKESYEIIHRVVLENGSIKYLHQRGIITYDDSGKALRMTGTSQDITVLENAKNEILKQYQELQNFVYIISHNVRSPISTLQSLVAHFDQGDPDTNEAVVRMIGQKVTVLDDTIKDLNKSLSLQKVSVSSYEWVDVEEVLANIQELLMGDIQLSKVHIETDIVAKKVYVVKSYLTNILFNLILNAINYKRNDIEPKIHISTINDFEKDMVKIIVRDNGIGMELNTSKRKRIFEMYGRLDGKSAGKGLGLFLAKTQVDTMNGDITVESEPGQGTIFTVFLNHIEDIGPKINQENRSSMN